MRILGKGYKLCHFPRSLPSLPPDIMLTPNSRDPGAGLGHKVHAAEFWRENSARCVRLETGGAWPGSDTRQWGWGRKILCLPLTQHTAYTGLALEANIYVHFFSYARQYSHSYSREVSVRWLA